MNNYVIALIVVVIIGSLLKSSKNDNQSNELPDSTPKEEKPKKRNVDTVELKKTLIEVKKYLKESEESIWAHDTPIEIISFFDTTIKLIDENKPIDIDELELLFAPTSSIQDISLDNGWGNRYLELSTAFDTNIGNI